MRQLQVNSDLGDLSTVHVTEESGQYRTAITQNARVDTYLGENRFT